MPESLRLLLIEDSEEDALLLQYILHDGGFEPTILRVETAEKLKQALTQEQWDIVISDYLLPGFDGLAALRIVREKCPEIPFIMISGKISEERAVEIMKAGAQDFILKGYLSRLVPAVRRELLDAQERAARKRAEEELRESEEKHRTLVEKANEGIIIAQDGILVFSNRRMTDILGLPEGCLEGKPLIDFIWPEDRELVMSNYGKRIAGEPVSDGYDFRILGAGGRPIWMSLSAAVIQWKEEPATLNLLTDVSERVRREQELQRDAQQATRVQNAMLPVPGPSDYLEIATVFQPFGYVGGDLYFMDWRYDGSLLRGFLVDATGHGLGTALHTASLHVLLREVNERDLPLADAMRWLNRRAGQYFDEGAFAGALGFELDLQVRQLCWVCAGIPKTWVATQTLKGVVECPGMSLGIREEETFDMHTMPVDVGDSFYFMTDGLTDLLEGCTDLPVDRYPEMVGLLRTLSTSAERRDDATAVCIHVNSLPQSLVRQDGWPRLLHFNGYGDYQRFKSEVTKIVAEVTGLPHSLQEVAINEALANAMECRDGVPRQHKTQLHLNKTGNRFIVRVKSSRMGFAGNAILRRLRSHPEEMFAFGEDSAMGRGIPMMLSMSHRMMYNSEGTEVLLAWKL